MKFPRIIFVPSSKLFEKEVMHCSYGNPTIRLRHATNILIKVVRENAQVLNHSDGKVWFRELVDSSLLVRVYGKARPVIVSPGVPAAFIRIS